MNQLSEQHIDIVYERLKKSALRNGKLEEDLLDHYCCHIEDAMSKGAEFETAFEDAAKDIAPNGVKEIEFELFLLINFNKQLSMKKTIFIIGFLSAFLLSSGIMFRTMHWPGANVMLVTSLSLVLITMVTVLLHLFSFTKNQSTLFWFRSITGVVSIMLIASGFLFKMFHMPTAAIQYTLGTLIFNLTFLPMFFYHLYKSGVVRYQVSEPA